MTPAGARLDRFLTRTIAELRTGRIMPDVGGKKLASDFSSMMADIRKSIDESKAHVADAVGELKAEIVNGAKGAALALRAEAAEVRKGFSEVVGNGAPDPTETKPPS